MNLVIHAIKCHALIPHCELIENSLDLTSVLSTCLECLLLDLTSVSSTCLECLSFFIFAHSTQF